MKVAHWTFLNGSGLSNMAVDMFKAEVTLGANAVLCNTNDSSTWAPSDDADVHVLHAHIPDKIAFDPTKKIVVVQHGAPEHIFEESIRAGLLGSYGASDPLAMIGYLLKRADRVVTFWPRQEALLKRMTNAPIHCIPMGIDKKFWIPVTKQKLLTGAPVLLTAENCHACKWPVDIMFFWPEITDVIPDARIHLINLPLDQHRWWLPLSYMTGTRYTSYMSPMKLPAETLRSFFSATDYYYSPVTYGDFNRICLEAKACGTKIISFRGNVYADYWITEGDQREQAKELIDILQGKREPREIPNVPDIAETGKAMLKIYEELLHGVD